MTCSPTIRRSASTRRHPHRRSSSSFDRVMSRRSAFTFSSAKQARRWLSRIQSRVSRTSEESGLALACACIAYSCQHCFHPVRAKYATELCSCHYTQISVPTIFSECVRESHTTISAITLDVTVGFRTTSALYTRRTLQDCFFGITSEVGFEPVFNLVHYARTNSPNSISSIITIIH